MRVIVQRSVSLVVRQSWAGAIPASFCLHPALLCGSCACSLEKRGPATSGGPSFPTRGVCRKRASLARELCASKGVADDGVDLVAQAVVPVMVSGTSVAGRAGRGRASALVLVCALAACVALLGSLSGAEEPVAATFLAVKAELQEKQSVHLGGHSMALAAKADSLSTTASGIMHEAAHSKAILTAKGSARVAEAKAKVAAAKSILKGAAASVGKQALEEAPAEEAPADAPAEAPAEGAPAASTADAAGGDDAEDGEKKKKILGASGEDVFGKKNGAVAGFLGFQEKGEPNILGVPLPVCMFVFVVLCTCTCLTVGCIIARKTDILKVNKEEAGAAAKPIDEVLYVCACVCARVP